MTNEELLEEAKRRYPKGTRFKPAHVKGTSTIYTIKDETNIKSGLPSYIWNQSVEKKDIEPVLYDNGKWAEIVSKPQIKEESVIEPKFIVGKWYRCTCNKNLYRFHSIKDGKFFVNDAVINPVSSNYANEPYGYTERVQTTGLVMYYKPDGLLTDLTEIQQYLPEGHPDKFSVKKDLMKELTSLPEKWAIQITKDNLETLHKWRNTLPQAAGHYVQDHMIGKYLLNKYQQWTAYYVTELLSEYTEITFDQFKKWVLKESDTLKIGDLVKGEIYCNICDYDFLFIYSHIDGEKIIGNNYMTSKNARSYYKTGFFNGIIAAKYRKATDEEKQWLQACIKAGKFVSLEDSKKPDVPEYVECIKNPEWADVNVGSIWKTDTAGYPKGTYRIVWPNGSGQTTQGKEHCFKPSTKEAYDAQFVKEDEDLTGRYIKALVDRPCGGGVRKNEIGIIKVWNKGIGSIVDFPSQKSYHCSPCDKDQLSLFEIMPKDFTPTVETPDTVALIAEQWVPKVGDWVVVLPEDSFYYNCEQDKAQQIKSISIHNPCYFLSFSNGDTNSYSKIRKALPHEIPVEKKVTVEELVSKNKTVEEWFNTLPPHLRDKAVQYCADNPYSYTLYDRCDSLEDALENGFYWDETHEGEDFWHKLERLVTAKENISTYGLGVRDQIEMYVGKYLTMDMELISYLPTKTEPIRLKRLGTTTI